MSNIVIIENYPTLKDEEKAIQENYQLAKEMSDSKDFSYANHVFQETKSLVNFRLDCSDGKIVAKDKSGNSINENIHGFYKEQIMSVLLWVYFPKCLITKHERESGVLNERLFAIVVGDSSMCGYTLIKTYSLQEINKSLSAFRINKASLLHTNKLGMILFNQKFVPHITSKNQKAIKKVVFEFLDDEGKLVSPILNYTKRKDFEVCKENIFNLRSTILKNNPDTIKKSINDAFGLVKYFTPRNILLEEWIPTLTDRVQESKNSGINAEYDEYLLKLTQEFLGNEKNIEYEVVTEE